MKNIKDLTLSELESYFKEKYNLKYKASQVFKWLSAGVTSFSEMTDISKKMAAELNKEFFISSLNVLKRAESKDKTVKFLYELTDKNTVETVLMTYKHGKSLCISTQVGCNMGCRFCASTVGGKVRDLTAGEILDQVIFTAKNENVKISNIVLMGIGEPLDNYDNVTAFLKNVNEEKGLNIGYRHISLSTCGIVPMIDKLAEEKLPITLSVSLHAPNNEIRKKIMPIAQKYEYKELLKSIRNYIEKCGRRVSFEYTMIENLNDSQACAAELSKNLKGMLCHVNLIPVNPARGTMSPTARKKIDAFSQTMNKNGINTTVRRTLGQDIDAACGQLRAKNKKDE